jgi:alkanesulfonate monooxygenase SsuD/methylene tetrahydromethanopterin reductase-like flavin-dependent oxidoreductase (luciferase family)
VKGLSLRFERGLSWAAPHADEIVTGCLNNEQIERFKKKLRRREEIAQFGRAITKS